MSGRENLEHGDADNELDPESAPNELPVESPVVESAVVDWPVVGSEAIAPLTIVPDGIQSGNVDDVLEQARGKEQALSQAIEELRSQADDLQKNIYDRRCEIVAQQTKLDEIIRVRGQLSQTAHHISRPPPIPPEAMRIRHGQSRNGRVSGRTTGNWGTPR